MTTTTPTAPGRTYDPQVIAAWLHGYEAGEHVALTLGKRELWIEGYDAGHADGIEAGRRQVDAELDAAAAAHSARVKADLRENRPAFDELCDRRAQSADELGHAESAAVERARAARQRQILRENGAWPMHTTTGHIYPANWPESERYCAHATAVVRATGSLARRAATGTTTVAA